MKFKNRLVNTIFLYVIFLIFSQSIQAENNSPSNSAVLLHPKENIEFIPKFPDSAPETLNDLAKIDWVDPLLCCELSFPKNAKPGKFIAPDGGLVDYWKQNSWQWKRKDGWIVWSGGNLISLLKGDEIRINAWRIKSIGEFNKRSVIQFRDKSVLIRWWNDYWNMWIVRYEKGSKMMRFVQAGSILPLTKQYDTYEIHYKKEYEFYIDIFFQSSYYQSLKNLLKKEFYAENKNQTPVLFFDTLEDFSGYLQEGKDPHPGGRGNIESIILCCKDTYGEPPKSELEKQFLLKDYKLNLMLHELTHNILWHGCFYKPGINYDNRIYPGIAFNEGMAEWATSTINSAYRTQLFKKNYKKMDQGKFPKNFSSLNKTSARAEYGYGPMYWLWYYIEENMGRKAINEYHTRVCGSQPGLEKIVSLRKDSSIEELRIREDAMAEQAAKSAFGMSREELYKAVLKHFTNNRAKYEALYAQWSSENLPLVDRISGDGNSERLPPNWKWPETTQELEVIPNIWSAYQMDFSHYPLDITNQFRGTGGELVHRYKKGSLDYSVVLKDYTVYSYFNSDGSVKLVQLQRGKKILRNYPDGRREIFLEDGYWAYSKPESPNVLVHGKNNK
jgi:hypothetical protein